MQYYNLRPRRMNPFEHRSESIWSNRKTSLTSSFSNTLQMAAVTELLMPKLPKWGMNLSIFRPTTIGEMILDQGEIKTNIGEH